MSVQSQDTYACLGVPLTVVGSGGGGGSNYPSDPSFSTISMLSPGGKISWDPGCLLLGAGTGLMDVVATQGLSLVAGAGALGVNVKNGAALGDLNVLNIYNLSTVNGAPYGAAALPANPAFSTINVVNEASMSTITNVSTINGVAYVPGGGALTNNPTFSTINVSTSISFASPGGSGSMTIISDPDLHNVNFSMGNTDATGNLTFYAPSLALTANTGDLGLFSVSTITVRSAMTISSITAGSLNATNPPTGTDQISLSVSTVFGTYIAAGYRHAWIDVPVTFSSIKGVEINPFPAGVTFSAPPYMSISQTGQLFPSTNTVISQLSAFATDNSNYYIGFTIGGDLPTFTPGSPHYVSLRATGPA